jgi:hypothetical protein
VKVAIFLECIYRGMSSSVESALTEGRVEQGDEAERVGIEQARGRQNLVREVNEPVLVGPLAMAASCVRSEPTLVTSCATIRWCSVSTATCTL